jgi:hypothetical protein
MAEVRRRSGSVDVQVSDGAVQVTLSGTIDHAGAAALLDACQLSAGVVRLHLCLPREQVGDDLCQVVREAERRSRASRCRLLVTATDPAVVDFLAGAGIVVDSAPPQTTTDTQSI